MSEQPKQQDKTPKSREQKKPIPSNRDPRTGDYIGDQGGYHD